MSIPEQIEVPNIWPDVFKKQLSFTNSHAQIISKIGIDRSTVGIFETFSRVSIPKQYKPIMKVISAKGDSQIESQIICYSGQSAELAGYSFVAVSLAIKLLEDTHKNTQNIRRVIRLCTAEVMKDEVLCKDIVSAARQMAINNHINSKSATSNNLNTANETFTIRTDLVDLNPNRPIDWQVSHWWSGE